MMIYAPFIGGYSDFWLGRMSEDEVSEAAKAEIARIRAEQKADPRRYVSRAEAAEIFGVSTNTIERLEETDELVSILADRRRLVSMISIYERRVRLTIKSNPKKGPKPKRNQFWGVRPDWKKRKAETEKRNGGGAAT
jgi:hypothetical protein